MKKIKEKKQAHRYREHMIGACQKWGQGSGKKWMKGDKRF